MCGCTKGTNGLVNSGGCHGKVAELHKIRNNLITLVKLTDSPEKEEEYESIREDVEQLLVKAVGACPDLQIVNALKEYIENEFSSHYN